MSRKAFDLINNPRLNKGTAFTLEERETYGLHGLLPPNVSTIEQQVGWALDSIRNKPQDIDKYRFMAALQKRNEQLYFRLLIDHIEELMPIVYTPTVGQACQEYAYQFRETQGFYVSFEHRGRISELMKNWTDTDVRLIVVTDGERILGLGDLGVSGMGIPIGKLALYSACAGIDPAHCMPITLDVGTDNEDFRHDPFYQGRREPRVRGETYEAFIEEFIVAVQENFPAALLQFEDFATVNAVSLLRKYRDRLLCFNDDIQGTAAVALAGLYAATRITNTPLSEMRFLFAGAGSAATGIAGLLALALQQEGLSEEEACGRCYVTDSKGLVTRDRPRITGHAAPFAAALPPMSLEEAVATIKPHVLIGATGRGGTFGQELLELMGRLHEQPIIFALSNPTTKAECTAENAYVATGGRAIFASGSPFGVVNIDGKIKVPGQGNNAYVFPGLGLGALQGGLARITEDLLIVAAKALAETVSDYQLEHGSLYPPLKEIRQVSQNIAVAVAQAGQEAGLTRAPLPADFAERLHAAMYDPRY
ncbi:MAG TPA: NAD-dependent malic enzyme [Hyphomicrobiales bacterium]|nr:NAD-dependent malic enzyme [Hyphomicrobiales bacterium]